ncbi:MAG: cobalamin-binding protein [Acidiferrobacterales bacterium]
MKTAKSRPSIVSLIPSGTEIVCAFGFEAQLVGRSHECDFPPAVRQLPVCTAANFDADGNGSEIHARVQDVLRTALPVYRVREDILARLQPDLIVTQTQCDVCAVSIDAVERTTTDWVASRPRIVALQAKTLAGLWEDIERVAEAVGNPQAARTLNSRLQQRIATVVEAARDIQARPTVACIEWIDPLMAAGNWVPELVELAAGVNLFTTAGEHSPSLRWDELRARDPDVILVMPCGFDIARSRRELAALTQRSGWQRLRAVQAARVFLTDGNRYFNRPGPRLVDSLEILAEVLHPQRFHFGHAGSGWQRAH